MSVKAILIALAAICVPMTLLSPSAAAGMVGVKASAGQNHLIHDIKSGYGKGGYGSHGRGHKAHRSRGNGHKAHRSGGRHRGGHVKRRRHRSGNGNINFKRARAHHSRRGYGVWDHGGTYYHRWGRKYRSHRRSYGYGYGGYGYGGYGDYGRGSSGRSYYDNGASARRSRSEAQAPADEPRPVVPKWVHVGPTEVDSGFSDGAPAANETQALTNCLTVKTQITVDGSPMDAFGRACLQADGTWRLVPTDPGS